MNSWKRIKKKRTYKLQKWGIGQWQTRRIQNGMDESEVGKKKRTCKLQNQNQNQNHKVWQMKASGYLELWRKWRKKTRMRE